MSDKPQIKLAEAVVLIDAAFLNFVITDIKGYFEETLRNYPFSRQESDNQTHHEAEATGGE